MQVRTVLLTIATVWGCTGCGSLISLMGYRSPQLQDNEWLVMSAEHRIITNAPAEKFNGRPGRNDAKRIVCPEPSPDVAKTVSQSFNLGIEAVKQSSSAAASESASGRIDSSRAVTESLVQLGQRVATLQLLRDELSDLCRSYANGAITSTTYTIRLSKLDRKMVTLLAVEGAAGALGKSLAAIEGSATAAQGVEVDAKTVDEAAKRLNETSAQLIAARKKASDLEAEAKALRAKGDKATAEEKAALAEKEGALRNASTEVEQKVAEVGRLQFDFTLALMGHSKGLAGASSRVTAGQLVGGGTSSPLSVVELQRAFLQSDELSTLIDACLTTLDTLPTVGPGEDARVQSLRQQLKDVEAEIDATNKGLRAKSTATVEQLNRGPITAAGEAQQSLKELVESQARLDGLKRRKADIDDQLKRAVNEFGRTPLSQLCTEQWPEILSTSTKIAEAQRTWKAQQSLAQSGLESMCVQTLQQPAKDPKDPVRGYCVAVLDEASKKRKP